MGVCSLLSEVAQPQSDSKTMKHFSLKEAKAKLCQQAGLLGEPCDSRLLREHYGKHHYSQREPELDLDFKSESAAIYVLVTACLYLLMVIVMVTLNYQLKQTTETEHQEKDPAAPRGNHSGNEKKAKKNPSSSSILFKEGRGVYSSLSNVENNLV